MRGQLAWFLTILGVLATGAVSCFRRCPPPGFDSVRDFNLEEFIKHSWYVQAQTVTAFQRLNTFYCTLATYEPKDKDNPLRGVTVYNYANRRRVNGPQMGTSGAGGSSRWFMGLEAVVPNRKDPSKLRVGLSFVGRVVPGFFLRAIYGPYWVVAVGEDPDGSYRWAIISAGAPEVRTKDGCKTASDARALLEVNGSGLWFFSRKPVDPASTNEMKSTAKNLGFDISNVYPVDQEGCFYAGAVLK